MYWIIIEEFLLLIDNIIIEGGNLTRIKRNDRYSKTDKSFVLDRRTDFEHDYDRIVYSSALRRLASVTQIFNPSEGIIFHNRLTHTLKVSQIAKRISQHIRFTKKYNNETLLRMGGLDPEVVATAALAHDLGNPPFGHAAEDILDELILAKGDEDGFEGNAQSFRIVARLACHSNDYIGLNLTRAVLNAILKYPWPRKNQYERKFGTYSSEIEYFNFARKLTPKISGIKCLEAAVMDLSDDITYGIHDFIDLFKADLIPFHTYYTQSTKIKKFNKAEYHEILNLPQFSLLRELVLLLSKISEEWAPNWKNDETSILEKLIHFFEDYCNFLPNSTYRGLDKEKKDLKSFEGWLITRLMENIQLDPELTKGKAILFLDEPVSDELLILKVLTKNYIFNSPSLTKQQYGEKKIIKELFFAFEEAVDKTKLRLILPSRAREELEIIGISGITDKRCYRIIGDAISSLTDSEAIMTYSVISGVQPGSIFDRLYM